MIKRGISFTPDQVKMQIFEIGDGQKCASCAAPLDPSTSQNGIITCSCGHKNEMSLEKTNAK